MTHSSVEKPHADAVPMSSVSETQASKRTRLRRIARILGCSPFLIAVPVFFFVAEVIPDRNRGSIGDGFRRLNAFLAVMLPVFGVCWAIAVMLAAYLDAPTLKGARRTLYIIGVSLICLFIVFVAVFLGMGW